MGFKAEIILDSIAPCGERLVTWILRYPRILLPEVNTHRVFSRNTSSSRAIPVKKLREQVINDPFVPEYWGAQQKGMAAHQQLWGWRRAISRFIWKQLRWPAVAASWMFEKIGLHKQLANRVLEPWLWVTQVLSTTTHANWFKLRDSAAAQPEIQTLARLMLTNLCMSTPQLLPAGEWHIPFILENERDLPTEMKLKIATARSARGSYANFYGKQDYADDERLHDQLARDGHWSPFEHSAMALDQPTQIGNFEGFLQYRKRFEGEDGRASE